MDNPEKLATQGTQDEEDKTKTIQRNWQHRVHKTKKNNPEKLATQGTQDEEKQSRETGNIEYTRRSKENKSTKQYVLDYS